MARVLTMRAFYLWASSFVVVVGCVFFLNKEVRLLKDEPLKEALAEEEISIKPVEETDTKRHETPMQVNERGQRTETEVAEFNALVDLLLTYQPEISRKQAEHYVKIVQDAAAEFQKDPLWVLAMVWQESRFINDSVSSAHAIGLMQILPSTAAGYGITVEELKVPEINIRFGVFYLSYLQDYFGDLRLATIAYNQGMGNVERGTYNTKYYVNVYQHYKNMQKYCSSCY